MLIPVFTAVLLAASAAAMPTVSSRQQQQQQQQSPPPPPPPPLPFITPAPPIPAGPLACDLNFCDGKTSWCFYWAGVTSWDPTHGPIPGESLTAIGPCTLNFGPPIPTPMPVPDTTTTTVTR
ncbi:hypothetical protein ACRE_012550 [Hapsidospora chrysogenum ATCC 11550]|uniref:Uncharacterized protein n=1 Tax=Hapsidospora chrysogenum (strain ATCC 11550 / CBS 779.69 / DSM 880 / IAM 14645 / JCM 23072 / IMI 49137) TaxID=857340 RepID=A0A086TF26_HAPC1|nr:hypothetical protein ACRE_012550 [Hapsidospora chrysogenum ATCC 11550]